MREPATHCEVLRAAVEYANANHFSAEGLDYSPIKGPEGNIEFLLFVRHDPAPAALAEELIEKTVRAAHEALDKAPNLHWTFFEDLPCLFCCIPTRQKTPAWL